ncbi:hypothetical protein V1478_004048 [Vespula squamosa]|uniref:Uncharacterized protein n=1 Tax=Vespula squamosa TaxID=30214 RepID=A0ABD2BP51_VESSQ
MPANDGGPVFELARNSYAGTTTEKKEPACSAWRALHPIIKVAFSRLRIVLELASEVSCVPSFGSLESFILHLAWHKLPQTTAVVHGKENEEGG